ncbi:general substrate transporter [Parathielavia appendiculata]|uniref:General substrate transporter n=1 Tax=Parathielavia appendiculata TaxID=2587402 RepID=A0AAN6YZ30_9PEZI|nr:general substrate transporter [Parathielavia appendiculata]
MAGGVKRPVNIFKLRNLGEPKEVFNWRLWFAVLSFSLLGAARGVDEGLISGAFNSKHFQQSIHFSSYAELEQANIKANVSAMVQIGSVGGALIAFFVCDRVGRIRATRQLCVLWIVGIAVFMSSNGNLAAIYAGRFIAGLGVGQTPVVGPVYIAEISPACIRGLCTCLFTGFVYLGIVLAYFTNYGCQVNLGDTAAARWLVPTSLHIMFASLIFVLSFFQSESPRYLIMKGQHDKAVQTMSRLRKLPPHHEYVVSEISAITAAYHEETEATKTLGWLGTLKEAFANPGNLYRVSLTISAQMLSQWSGAGSITLYAPDLFHLVGISDTNTSLLVTAVFGIVKLLAAVICALFLVDVIGRKRALLLGIACQAVAMVYVAGFLTAVPQRAGQHQHNKTTDAAGQALKDSRLAAASKAAVAMIYLSGVGWALGWNSFQYLVVAELFPLRIRAFAASLAMTFHFANQYGNARAVPNMLLPVHVAGGVGGGLSPQGTFWFFAAVTVLGGVWVWFAVPETAGRGLESMDRLFTLPWYMIGRYGNREADGEDGVERGRVGERESK